MKLRAPNTFVLLFLLTAFVAGLTWILPGGAFERVERDGRTVVVPGTWRAVEPAPQGVGALFTAPIRGFVEAANVIGFVLLVGGTFGILQRTGAIDAALRALAAAHGRSALVRRGWIPLFMVVFSLGGATFGMSEETIPFVLIFVPLALALGYDSITGVAVPFVGAGAGFAAAFLNPFTLGVAQGIAELPINSGLGYRLICWTVVTGVAIAWVMAHAARVRRRPETSPTFDLDEPRRKRARETQAEGAGRLR
jgi:uncharacterized ion transporter superfamily protein YfcC